MSTPLDDIVVNRLARFIHTGLEVPKYYPGFWLSQKYFETDKPLALLNIFETNKNNTEVVDIILKAYREGYFTRFETIAFALAKCIHLGSEIVKQAAYNAALQVCTTPEDMLMFNYFTKKLHTGNGRGWCKFVKRWYKARDVMQLTQDVTRVRARHGRSHKCLISKSHMKVDESDHARKAIIMYVLLGLNKTKMILGQTNPTEEVFAYIQKIEDMRVCEDPLAAARMVTEHKLLLEHVPGHLLTSKEVWNAVLPQLTTHQLLKSIQRLHNLDFLSEPSTTTTILCDQLTNQDKINSSQVTPIEVYITICNYEMNSMPLKYPKAKVALEREKRRRLRQVFNETTQRWEWTVTSGHAKERKTWGIDQPPNTVVIKTLYVLLEKTWKLTQATQRRYMITLDMRDHMFKGRHFCKPISGARKRKMCGNQEPACSSGGNVAGDGVDTTPIVTSKKQKFARCFYNSHVQPGYAAVVLMLQLLRRDESTVKVAVFTEEGVQLMDTQKFTDITTATGILKSANLGRVQLDAPMRWASENNEQFDVFINMIDRSTRFMELDIYDRCGRGEGARFVPPPVGDQPDRCPARALERYRKQFDPNNAKLIVMSLASHRVMTTDGSHEGVLDIVGIDEYVPKLIDAFSRDLFK